MADIHWKTAGTYADILYEKAEGIAKITINRPEVRNAFRPSTVDEMSHALSDARFDDDVGVIILTGKGEKAFCSGGGQKIRGEAGYVDDTGRHRLNVLDFQRQMRTCPKPIIAMVAGYAIGGGHIPPLPPRKRVGSMVCVSMRMMNTEIAYHPSMAPQPAGGQSPRKPPQAPLNSSSRVRGGKVMGRLAATHQVVEVPIERLKAGDMVFSYDGKPHKILETFRRTYSGLMFHIAGENGKSLCLTEDHLVLTERRVKHLTPSGQWSGIPHHHFGRARAMRQAMSPPELAVWCSLRGKQMGVKFRKQHPIGPYIADFYGHECGLVAESDGEQHFETEEAQSYDRERGAFMENLGLIVLRFSAHDAGANLGGVLASIYRMAKQHTLKSDSQRQWCFAEALRPGDTIYNGVELCPIRIVNMTSARCVEEVFDIKVDDSHAYITGVCVIHNCGAGTTAAEPVGLEFAGFGERCTGTRPGLEGGRND